MPVSGRKFCRLLEKNGWSLNRITGSHHIYNKRGVPRSISVPVHGNASLKKGILSGLEKAAGVKAR